MIKKVLFIIITVISLFSFSGFAAAPEGLDLQEFYGGRMNLTFNWNSDTFFGARGDAQKTGGTVSTIDFNQSFTSYNPASLAYAERTSFSTSMFLIPIPIGSFAGAMLTSEVDKMVEDTVKTEFEAEIVESPKVGLNVGQDVAITGFEIVMPFARNQVTVGLAREEKHSLSVGLQLSGTEALIKFTDKNTPLLELAMRAKINAMLDLQTKHIVTSLGVGRRFTPEWGAGVVLEKYDSSIYMNAAAQIDAVGTLAGNTLEFNTDEHNSLAQSLRGDLTAEAWGIRVGTAYHFLNGLIDTSLDVAIEPEIKFHGDINAITHAPEFMKDGSVDFGSIDLSDFTKTVAKDPNADGTVRMKNPSYLRFAFAWKPGMVLGINYTHYFDPFYIQYNDTKAFIHMMDAFRIGFNFNVFQFGGGIILAKEGMESVVNGEKKITQVWYPIPLFSIGFNVPIDKIANVECVILAAPSPLLKTALTFNF